MAKKIAKKVIKKEKPIVEPKRKKVEIIKEIEKEGDIVLGVTPCLKCGKPSTIISPEGNPFCCLSCQTNY